MVSDGALKLILFFILLVVGLTFGFTIGGPILAGWTLTRSWINTSWWIKAGAIIFPLIGVAAGLELYVFSGEALINLGNLLLAAWLVAIQPLLTYILLGVAYSRRDNLM